MNSACVAPPLPTTCPSADTGTQHWHTLTTIAPKHRLPVPACGVGLSAGQSGEQRNCSVQTDRFLHRAPAISYDPNLSPPGDSNRHSRRDSNRPSRRDSNRPSRRDSNRPCRRDSNRPCRRDSNRPCRRDSNRTSLRNSNRPSRRDSNRPSRRDSNRPSRRFRRTLKTCY